MSSHDTDLMVAPDRPEFTWEHFISRLGDRGTTAVEAEALLRGMHHLRAPEGVETVEVLQWMKVQVLLNYAREVGSEKTRGNPPRPAFTRVSAVARLMLVRMLPELTHPPKDRNAPVSSWRRLHAKQIEAIQGVLAFLKVYGEYFLAVGNNNDKKMPRAFLYDIWNKEELTRAGRIPFRDIEAALVACGCWEFLKSRCIMRALPKIARSIDPEVAGRLKWPWWKALPVMENSMAFRVTVPDRRELRSAIFASDPNFPADLEALTLLSGRGQSAAHELIGVLVARATHFRQEFLTRELRGFTLDSTIL